MAGWFFGWFDLPDRCRSMEDRLRKLEKQVAFLEHRLEEQVRQTEPPKKQKEEPPVVIERLCVERLNVEKVELVNNLGTLEIRELSGMLNIGAAYGVGHTAKAGEPASAGPDTRKNGTTPGPEGTSAAGAARPPSSSGTDERRSHSGGSGPRCTIRARATPSRPPAGQPSGPRSPG
jgi:TolA-binding protein